MSEQKTPEPLTASLVARLFDVPEEYLRISLHHSAHPPTSEEYPVTHIDWTRGTFTIDWDATTLAALNDEEDER